MSENTCLLFEALSEESRKLLESARMNFLMGKSGRTYRATEMNGEPTVYSVEDSSGKVLIEK